LNKHGSGFVATKSARRLTIVLLVLHTGGCAADLATEQYWLMSAICLAGAGALAGLFGFLFWLLLALSWGVGLLAVRWPTARPVYWLLLAAIPIAHFAQEALLERGVLTCDGP
jgi:hypothetical protein